MTDTQKNSKPELDETQAYAVIEPESIEEHPAVDADVDDGEGGASDDVFAEDERAEDGLAEDEPAETESESDEPAEDPDLALTRKINGLATLVRTYYAQGAKEGSTIDPLRGQGRVLALLAMKPETTQKELQYLLDMKQQSLSELLTKLEAKGFVEKQKSTEDGRVTVVRLTEAGAAAAPNPAEKPRVTGAYDCLSDEERAQFEQSVDAVSASLKEKLGDVEVSGHGPHEHGEEEGEQKRHRYGRMGRGGRGGQGGQGSRGGRGGHGPGGEGHGDHDHSHDHDHDGQGGQGSQGSKGHGRGAKGHGVRTEAENVELVENAEQVIDGQDATAESHKAVGKGRGGKATVGAGASAGAGTGAGKGRSGRTAAGSAGAGGGGGRGAGGKGQGTGGGRGAGGGKSAKGAGGKGRSSKGSSDVLSKGIATLASAAGGKALGGKGSADILGKGIAGLASAAVGTSSLSGFATQVLKEAEGLVANASESNATNGKGSSGTRGGSRGTGQGRGGSGGGRGGAGGGGGRGGRR